MKNDESKTDRLMDALLKEDARGGADEEFLAELEKEIDGNDEESADGIASRRSVAPLAWAAVLTISVAGAWVYLSPDRKTDMAAREMGAPPAPKADTIAMQIRAQEQLVEEKRKLFHTIVKADGIPYIENVGKPGLMGLISEEEREGTVDQDKALQSKDYVEAKRDYNLARRELATLKGETELLAYLGNPSEGSPAKNGKRLGPAIHPADPASVIASRLPSPVAIPRPEGVVTGIGPVAATDEEIGVGWGDGGDGGGGSFFGRRAQISPGGHERKGGEAARSAHRFRGDSGGLVRASLSEDKASLAKLETIVVEFQKKLGPPIEGLDDDGIGVLDREIVRLRRRIVAAERHLEGRPVDRERYGQLVDQPWNTPWQAPLSTFSVDVDTASYTNIRRMLRSGVAIPKDAVRLEECINYFDYRYPTPQKGGPFAVHVDMASCPWQEKHYLVKIGLKGKEVGTNERPPSNLVFLIDVSGSMNQPNKLPLLVESMKILVEELDERDSVGIVVYAGSAGTVLEPTKVVANGRTEILSALSHLRSGGSTAGAAGIRGAYELAAKHYKKDGVNRVILATDGDFNVGTSSNGELVELVKEKAKSGVYLSVLGFGNGNINDSMLEAITNDGNGTYYYIDTQREGRKVFLEDLSGTLVTIAKDVKIQVEFNPGKVAAYRLIGYANRILPPEAFNDDTVDAGDIGAGHTVTALYEVVPMGVEVPKIGGVDALKYQKPANRGPVGSPEWMTVKLRYKAPDGEMSTLLEIPVKNDPIEWRKASGDFQFAAGVALFGEKLRGSDKIDDAAWELVAELAQNGSAHDPHGYRAEFRELVSLAGRLPVEPKPVPVPAQPGVEAPPASR